MSRAFVIAAVLAAAPVSAGTAAFTLIFSGDNGGEVAPCG